MFDDGPKQADDDDLSDLEAMGILYAVGQPIDTVDKLTLEQIRLAAHLVQLGLLIRRHDDLKAQISALGR